MRTLPLAAALLATALTGTALTGTALAESHMDKTQSAAVDARQAHMTLYAFNLGLLGAIAKGETEYDAASAQVPADRLAALTAFDQSGYWVEGTEAEMIEETAALSAIWSQPDDFAAKIADLASAAQAMKMAAGEGPEAIGAAMQQIGGACGACHRSYRERN